ncbi:MAG: hypothetical protein JW850_14130 [Thermoflexales bacterium]|nr:hypothetical protein [Thermoflexales bacterium]
MSSFQRLSSRQQGLLLVALSSAALVLLGVRGALAPARSAPPPTPMPPYPPLTGHAFITTLGTSNDSECLWNRPSHVDRYQSSVGCKPHGTPVEILQHVWMRGTGQTGCYCYLVRVDDADSLGGWVGGYALSHDLAAASGEHCPWQPAPKPSPEP